MQRQVRHGAVIGVAERRIEEVVTVTVLSDQRGELGWNHAEMTALTPAGRSFRAALLVNPDTSP
jgi:hypothetical protein